MARIIIPGKPMGKQRPRVMRSGITFTPKETVNYENLVKLNFIEQAKHWKMTEDPVSMKIFAYFPIPKSTTKNKKELILKEITRPDKKPDCDNIVKIICDALNNIAYHDDSQVVDLSVSKFYSESPRVEIEIYEI